MKHLPFFFTLAGLLFLLSFSVNAKAPADPRRAILGTVAYVAAEDTYVSATNPSNNYGAANPIIASDFDANYRTAYLKFRLPPGTVLTSATLELTAMLSRKVSKTVHAVSSGWTEPGLTYANRPTPGPVAGVLNRLDTALAVGETVSIPLDTGILTPEANGDLSLAVNNDENGNTFSFSSREGSDPPRLVVTGQGLAGAAGDADGDGDADAEDYRIWRREYRSTGIRADFDKNGRVDGLDYAIWLANYGRTSATPTAAVPSRTPTPERSPTPTRTPTPTPPGPSPTPYPGSGIGPISLSYRQGGLWLTPAEIDQIPMDNPSWDSLVLWANKPMDIMKDIGWTSGGAGSTECISVRAMFARAIVGLRTDNNSMLTAVRNELDRTDDAINATLGTNTDIKWGQRNIPLIAVTANLLDYRPAALQTALHRVIRQYIWPENKTIEQAVLTGLANKPAHGRWGLMAVAYLTEDFAAVNAAVKAHAKAMGESDWGGAPNTHVFDLSGLGSDDNWQTLQPGGKNNPIAIMPQGTFYQDHGVGGLYLADQYRAENGPVWPPSYTNYSWEGFGPTLTVAFAADHLGYRNVFSLGNYAVLRMVLWQYSNHDGKTVWKAEGNDVWTVAAVMTWAKLRFGNTIPESFKPEPGSVSYPLPADPGGDPGRSMGWMYATHYARLAR